MLTWRRQVCLQTGLLASKAKSGLIEKSKSGLIEKRNNKAARKIKMIRVSAKGKKQWVGKNKEKFSVGFVQNGNLNIDKRQCLVKGGNTNSEESSSSSEDSLGIRFFKDSFKSRGEALIDRPTGLDGFQNKDIGLQLCVDLGLVEVSFSKLLSHYHLKPILEDVDEETCIYSEVGDEEENEVMQLSEMIDKETDPKELVQALVTVEEDYVNSETLLPNSTSKKKGKLSTGSITKHKMKTHNFGIIEEEVSKVMEVGNLLGLDFSSIEKEVSDVIASREAEDLARMENQ
ncbi:hypothetical protein LWI29_013773 [Acer saccharum]|uniref:Uncharacterized protein n=1 Tax=Acer saccharum TaxID=4024 RepID=A0AA39RDM5_ACESA|nr:hypothetical protein LWI29_013773 [Acer saccharum]